MITQNVPKSYEQFKNKFLFAIEKANKTENTIFMENINLDKIGEELIQEHYTFFNKNYRSFYESAADNVEKNKIINASINESFFQHNFNIVLDSILESGTVSMNTEFLLENTVEKFNLSLEKIGKRFLDSDEKIENKEITENVFSMAAATGGLAAGLGAMPTIALTGVIALASSFFLPAKTANDFNNQIQKWFGSVIATIIGAGDIFSYDRLSPNLARSHRNIIKFDNIQADESVKKLFLNIQKTGVNVKEARNGLEALVGECLSNNKDILNVDPDQKNDLIGLLQRPFNPQSYNVLKLLWKSIFSDANSDESGYGTLLRFRKCLSNKLVDVYKLLLISNLQDNKDHKRIMDQIGKSNNRPEHILSFLPSATEEEERLKKAILSLVQFRIYLNELAGELEKGFFKVDQEAGKYLKQKLSTVDSEVENYLRLNSSRYKAPFEGNLMDRKPSIGKRDLLSIGSSL